MRVEVDLTADTIRFHALRRRTPENQPLLKEIQHVAPSVRTIGRILLRRGALDGRRRVSFKLGVLNNIVHIASVVRWADRLIEDSDVLGMIRILYFLSETFDGRLAFKIGRRFAQSSARGTVFLHERRVLLFRRGRLVLRLTG